MHVSFTYSLRVLGRTIINCTATCVIPWIIFFSLGVLRYRIHICENNYRFCCRSLTIAIFIGIILGNHQKHSTTVNQIGFIIINIVQPIIVSHILANLLYPFVQIVIGDVSCSES